MTRTKISMRISTQNQLRTMHGIYGISWHLLPRSPPALAASTASTTSTQRPSIAMITFYSICSWPSIDAKDLSCKKILTPRRWNCSFYLARHNTKIIQPQQFVSVVNAFSLSSTVSPPSAPSLPVTTTTLRQQ